MAEYRCWNCLTHHSGDYERCNNCISKGRDKPTNWHPGPNYVPPSNADRFRAMSDEELAEQLVVAVNGVQPCALYYSIPTNRSFLSESEAVKVTMDWLQQPAEEDT